MSVAPSCRNRAHLHAHLAPILLSTPRSFSVHRIYDEESDRHVHIPFRQALYATCYGADGGPVADIFGFQDLDTPTKDKTKTHAKTAKTFNGETAEAVTNPDDMFDASKTNNSLMAVNYKDNDAGGVAARKKVVAKLVDLVEKGVWVPVEIVIARPFIEHLTLSAVVAVAGRDTGATLFGPADMQLSANTSVKTIEGCACARACARAVELADTGVLAPTCTV